jgi:hypothetical protein
MLVATNKELYVSLPKKQKMLLSQSIVNAVRSQQPMGRFLQKDANSDLWFDVGDKRAQEKTSQALREGAPELRHKLSEQKVVFTTTPTTSGSISGDESSVAVAATKSADPDAPTVSKLKMESAPLPPPQTVPIPIGNGVVAPAVHSSPAPEVEDLSVPPPVTVVRHTSKEQMPPPAAVMVGNNDQSHHVTPPPPPPPPTLEDQQAAYYHPPYVNPSPHNRRAAPIDPYHLQSIHETSSTPDLIPDKKFYPSAMHSQQQDQYPSTIEPYNQATSSAPYPRDLYFTTDEDFAMPPPPPSNLDPHGDCSFGSMGLMSDAEQARLENGVSFGQSSASAAPVTNSSRYADHASTGTARPPPPPQPLHHRSANPNNNPHVSYAQPQHSEMHYPPEHYRASYRNEYHNPHVGPDDGVVPQPVDGGLEPIGLSFGSMMSMGTATAEAAAAAAENIKLEDAGLSFGSMMSYSVAGNAHGSSSAPMHSSAAGRYGNSNRQYSAPAPPPDGGLADIGTSFGSLTLAEGDRERIIAEAERDMLLAMRGSGKTDHSSDAAAPPSFLQQQKSKGNLLDCSDTESEDEETSGGISAQKSADWDKMQAAMAKQIQNLQTSGNATGTAHTTMPPPPFGGGGGVPPPHRGRTGMEESTPHSSNPSGTTFHMPTMGLDREFSQMSAISVGEDFDPAPASYRYDHHPTPQSDRDYRDSRDPHQERQQYHVFHMPPPPPPPPSVPNKQTERNDQWKEGDEPDLEYTYLNRGNSLASEPFSEAPELAKTFDR